MTLFNRNIYDLDKRVVFQKPTKTSNGMGGFTTTWSSVTNGTVWARLLPVSAKESRTTEKETMTISHTATIRYRRDIRPTYRVKFKKRYFAIVGMVNPEECNEWLDMNLQEVKV